MAVFRNLLHLCQHYIDSKFKRDSWFSFPSPLIEGKGIVSEELPLVSVDLPPPSQPLVKIVKKIMQFTKNSPDVELL